MSKETLQELWEYEQQLNIPIKWRMAYIINSNEEPDHNIKEEEDKAKG